MELRRGGAGAGANPRVLKVCGKGGEVSRKKWTKLLPCGQDFIFWDEGKGADYLVVASKNQSLPRHTPSLTQGLQGAFVK